MTTINFTELRAQFDREAAAAGSMADVERLRNKYLSRSSGILTEASAALGGIADPAARREYGKAFGAMKARVTAELEALQEKFRIKSEAAGMDLTMPGVVGFIGGLHPLTQVLNELVDIFRGMGFSVAEGPEAETVYNNFDALNTPPNHPSRDLTDTFYLDVPGGGWLLRTHTSPVQIRVMKERRPPVRIIAPGRTYRNDKPDATHSPTFMQVEGLYVDRGVTFADLKGTVLAFFRALYGPHIKARFRPSFFPFTEPSAEVDISCIFCKGEGCRVCKHTTWLEMGGAGMVHPSVLAECGVDAEEFSGWAFGMGLERIAMFRYDVDDIRLFYENNVRFLGQFA